MRLIRRLWPYYRPEWHLVALSFLQIGLATLLGVSSPQIVRWMVDQVLTQGRWTYLVPGAAAVVVAAIVQGFLRYGQRYTMERVSQRVVYELRSDLYRHLQELSFSFYDKAQTGELMSRVTADVEALRQAAGMGLVNGSMHMTTIVGIVITLLIMDWRLALVSLLFLPFLVFAMGRFSSLSHVAWKEVQDQTATLSAAVQENLSGVRVVRAFAREEEEIAKFERANADFQEMNLKAIRLQSFWSNFMNFLTALGAVAVLWFGGRRVMSGAISVGTLIAFNTYLANLLNPVRMVSNIISMFTRAGAGLTRIFELMDTRRDLDEKSDATVLGRLQGEVVFENVSFGYEGTPVLAEINLRVKPGQRVAVLGLTGSGKSSLVNLVPRFYDPTEGRVLVDGHDVRDVTLESLRRNIGMVLQETFLFSTTLRENIAYGKPGATMDEVIVAAKAAQIHDFITSLPDGYETLTDERGVGLSGGQKQRVAIARALLMDTPLLILDESTSAIDVQTEHLIQAAMDRVMQGRTAFVIASRLSTVMNADLVVVLEHGRIAEMGNHAELISKEGLYRTIYDLQLKPAEEYRASKGVAV
ncbi:MAG TPA: ABC transporter ATP-binding protein [Symbiobacteriaceae bacterium]|nr:ABC transporter ATP-binding protein [Symbiobacteriaceae bacterium]